MHGEIYRWRIDIEAGEGGGGRRNTRPIGNSKFTDVFPFQSRPLFRDARYFHRSIISPMLGEGRCHAPHPSTRPIRIGVGRGYSILCTYTDYRACHDRHTFDTTRIKRVAIQLPLRFFISLSLVSFLPVRRVERRFSDRGQISRKDGITICKRTGGVGNRSSCLRFDVSSPTPTHFRPSISFVSHFSSVPFLSLSSFVFPFFLRFFTRENARRNRKERLSNREKAYPVSGAVEAGGGGMNLAEREEEFPERKGESDGKFALSMARGK